MMNTANELNRDSKVVKINVNQEDNKTEVYEMIGLILSDLATASENTAKNYKSNWKEFFKLVVGKEMKFVTWKELMDIKYSDVMRYRNELKEFNGSKTINIKIASLTTLFRHLKRENNELNIGVVDLAKLPEYEEDTKQYGSLTEDEVDSLLAYCRELPARQKPLEKEMFFKTAFITAIRVQALLNMKWKDIRYLKDTNGENVRVIHLRDKGKEGKTPITEEFYEELLQLQNSKEYQEMNMEDRKESKIIKVTDKTLRKTLKEFCERSGIEEDRNIVLHSLKKASLDKVYGATKNINLTARHGHHSGVEMVYRHYEGKNESFSDRPSFSMFDGKLDDSRLEDLSKEELLEAIGRCSEATVNEILSKVK